MTTELDIADFADFMQEVTGFPPFPWQQRLLEQVLESGWPDQLDLPTGTGKTATLLIALFALALQPESHARRIALIVDRRIIVDQTEAFARKIQTALDEGQTPTVKLVATRLQSICVTPNAPPLRVVQLRGGVPRDDQWLGTPDQPTMIASTVDQVGSRLLFRGYGVSEGMRPVHAGVLARDTVLFLDEVHLATAFEGTLRHLMEDFTAWGRDRVIGRPLRVVRMSATPRSRNAADASTMPDFRLDDADRKHPVLQRRLDVPRRATLVEVKTKKLTQKDAPHENRKRIAADAAKLALEAVKAGRRRIGIVVNRVDTARRTLAELERTRGKASNSESLLVTGRMRAFDRDDIQLKLEELCGAGKAIDPSTNDVVFVVATSCIEAGADLDFDALITEVASLDALRQRFGRLNRLGAHDSVSAWVLGPKHAVASSAADDPVYGESLKAVWAYLQAHADDGSIDFGLEAFPSPSPEQAATLMPPAPSAPTLLPSYLDTWSETRPTPYPDPEVSLWLHGKDVTPERDIQLVWRADFELPSPDASARELQLERGRESLEFLPPSSEEAVAVPMHEARTWLGQHAGSDTNPDPDADAQPTLTWRWSAEGLELVAVGRLRPGDTVIVACARGGLSLGNWNPEAKHPVIDVAEIATHRTRAVTKLRLHPNIVAGWFGLQQCPPADVGDDPDTLEAAREQTLELVRGLADLEPDHKSMSDSWLGSFGERTKAAWVAWKQALAKSEGSSSRPGNAAQLDVTTSPDDARHWRFAARRPGRALEATTEDAVSAFSGCPVSLKKHGDDVRDWALAFGLAAGLDAELAGDLALAAAMHDIGKAHERFQVLLHGGDRVAALADEPLAKSRQSGSYAQRARAGTRSGWPEGMRHELVSLLMFEASPELRARAHDVELVRHLIASHHGWCRPWPPAITDSEATTVEFEYEGTVVTADTGALSPEFFAGCVERFAELTGRYGWHGLAHLEALLRLADHRASATPDMSPVALGPSETAGGRA